MQEIALEVRFGDGRVTEQSGILRGMQVPLSNLGRKEVATKLLNHRRSWG